MGILVGVHGFVIPKSYSYNPGIPLGCQIQEIVFFYDFNMVFDTIGRYEFDTLLIRFWYDIPYSPRTNHQRHGGLEGEASLEVSTVLRTYSHHFAIPKKMSKKNKKCFQAGNCSWCFPHIFNIFIRFHYVHITIYIYVYVCMYVYIYCIYIYILHIYIW